VPEGEDDSAEGVALLVASGQPDVVLAHRVSGAGLERRAAFGDELVGSGQLGLQLGQEGRVGGELVAGQAGFSELSLGLMTRRPSDVGSFDGGRSKPKYRVVDYSILCCNSVQQ